jgi:hypothetical protein
VTLIVNWRGSDELLDGSAKAPTDTGAESSDPAALDADGREHLELKELALNYSVEDACFWLRRSDDSLAKFRPGAVVLVVDQESALPAAGSPAAPWGPARPTPWPGLANPSSSVKPGNPPAWCVRRPPAVR